MKRLVVNVGLPRTGTSSVRRAMGYLGWRVQDDPFANWRLKLLFGGHVIEAIEADVKAGFDFLSEPYYAWGQQVAAEVARLGGICFQTVREPGSWVASLERQAERPRLIRPDFHPSTERPAEHVLLATRDGGGVLQPVALRAWLSAAAVVVPDLKVCAGEGWDRLCQIVGAPVPPGVSFPRENVG